MYISSMLQFLALLRAGNMKTFYIFLFLLRLLQCRGKYCSRSMKLLRMTVLYESLCSESQSFSKDFWVVYQDYHKCINLTLIPYGKAKSTESGHVCQHGELECWGNRLHDCALHSNLNQLQQMQFIACQMRDLKLAVKRDLKCAKFFNIVKSIRNCMRSNGIGNQYQDEAARKTEQYTFSEIPAIIYNGKFDESMQKAFKINVRQALCDIMVKSKQLLPEDC